VGGGEGLKGREDGGEGLKGRGGGTGKISRLSGRVDSRFIPD